MSAILIKCSSCKNSFADSDLNSVSVDINFCDSCYAAAHKCEDCDAIVKITFEPYGSSPMATIECPNCGVSYDTNLDPIESENK